MRRRVLIVVENLPVPFDRRVWAEATTLAAHGCEVSVISPMMQGAEAPYEHREGVHVHRHPLTEARGAAGYAREYGGALRHQFALARAIWRARGFDVIHGCNPPDLVFLLARAWARRGVRFVFDHHDLCPELYETKFGRRGPLWHLMGALERATFRAADVSIATNESYREIAIRRGGMAPEDVFVVRSGPRLDRLVRRPPRPELKRGARHLIGYVGVIGRQEGLDLLLAAADRLVRGMGRDVHFGIVGDGPELPAIRSEAARRGLAERFTFTGRAPDEQMLDMLSTADLCVNPDRATPMNDLSTMNKVLEYMALGKPIVQFDLTEGRRSAGEASLYAAPDDPEDFARCVARLLDDPGLRQRMGAAGRARIEDALSWRHSVGPLLAAYDRVFEKAASSPAR